MNLNMTRFIKISLTLTFAMGLFSGCANRYNYSPEDTILDNRHENRPDWIDNQDFYSEAGLSMRSDDTFSGKSVSSYVNNQPIVSVYFGYDHSDIRPQERAKLRTAIDALKSNVCAGLLIVGKCDWHGTEEYNLALGDRRANNVKFYLTELGVDPDRIRTLSKGSLEATVGLSAEEGGRDRRADIIVME